MVMAERSLNHNVLIKNPNKKQPKARPCQLWIVVKDAKEIDNRITTAMARNSDR